MSHSNIYKHNTDFYLPNGAVYIGSYFTARNVRVNFNDLKFDKNVGSEGGSCIYFEHFHPFNIKNFQILMADITAHDNSQANTTTLVAKAGIFTFLNAKSVTIIGSNKFCKNLGSVFEAINTNINIGGILHFENNNGEEGSSFKLIQNSNLVLQSELRATFVNNSALTKGGAIYAQDNSYTSFVKYCTFQITSPYTISQLNISMLFINNNAEESGDSVFSTNIYNCYINDHYLDANEARIFYRKITNESLAVSGISTVPEKICLCFNGSYICSNIAISLKVYPGQILSLPLAALDLYDRITYSEVSLTLSKSLKYVNAFSTFQQWQIKAGDFKQRLLETKECTVVNVTLYKNELHTSSSKAVLVVSSLDKEAILKLKLDLLECPIGFELNSQGVCDCSKVVREFGVLTYYQLTCKVISNPNISSQYPLASMTKMPDSSTWIGLLNVSNEITAFGIAQTCHKYCNLLGNSYWLLIEGTNIYLADRYLRTCVPLCPVSREGILCSKCKNPQHSVIFGSTECKYCSNFWLLTIVLFLMAGPILIYFLYALKLTLTVGTLNGIIFYAQSTAMFNEIKIPIHGGNDIVNGEIAVLDFGNNFMLFFLKVTKFCIAVLNFNLGFPLCFYDGMTELWKAGLNLLFPMYLLMIVLILIILCRYSVWLSNKISHSSVQVLVTVVHLSFSRLLATAMDVFTSVNIHLNTTTEPHKVWYSDGTVSFAQKGHLILMIITALVVGSTLLLYMGLLIGGRLLQKCNKIREYIRPIYEAIHAPYRRNKEFFFAARLLLIATFYVLYGIYRSNDIYLAFSVGIIILSIYISVESFNRPFINQWLNLLNLFCAFPMIVIASSFWYFNKINYAYGNVLVIMTCTLIITCMFIFIIFFHFLWVTGLLKKLQSKMIRLLLMFQLLSHSLSQTESSERYNRDTEFNTSFFESCSESREPLLSPS